MIIKGKRVGGPKPYIPKIFFFGGYMFVNWLDWGWMIPIHKRIIDEASLWGIDLIGD